MTTQDLEAISDNTELQNGITIVCHIPKTGVCIRRESATTKNSVQFIHYNDIMTYSNWQKKPEKKPPFDKKLSLIRVVELLPGNIISVYSAGSTSALMLHMDLVIELHTLLSEFLEYRKEKV